MSERIHFTLIGDLLAVERTKRSVVEVIDDYARRFRGKPARLIWSMAGSVKNEEHLHGALRVYRRNADDRPALFAMPVPEVDGFISRLKDQARSAACRRGEVIRTELKRRRKAEAAEEG
jgi:hypothetical protein